ncbi:winged helix-turn-helix domain-containing protein [Methanolobus sp.]|uniref:helix-turn-helix transcriptional regulator n=1 Tax=Methanolobus sp. TaxID=1874737 RepID=UPI0025E0D71D|nr:winged helix-turn-helix domain-containing protein [Methanolobus sp.]
MKRPIVEILLSSEKRKKTLMLLQDGPREMEAILRSLDTTRTALLPQMKVLKERHLVSQHDDIYELTTIGKLIVKEMASFLKIAETFGENSDYLGTHCIDFIPEYLLEKLPLLGSYDVINIPIYEMFNPDIEMYQKALKSKYWFEASSVLYPTFHDFYVQMIEHNIDISVIITRDFYEKAKEDYYDHLKEIVDLEFISLYVYPGDLGFASLIVTDECIRFRLFTHEHILDSKKLQICGPAALEWGKELLEYYRQQSTIITQV